MLAGGLLLMVVFLTLPGQVFAQQRKKPATSQSATCAGCNLLPKNSEQTTNVALLPDAPLPAIQNSQSSNSEAQTGTKPKNQPSAPNGSPGHIFWVVPAFKVEYGGHFQPLTPKEKFTEWAQGVYDPLGLGVGAFEAGTLQYSSKDGFCGYGHGWDGYGKCFASLQADSTISSFIGDYVLTVWWHQDPRYFRLGQGSFGKRLFYAVSRVFVTYNDKGKTVFYSSALSGTAISAGVSNLYYPRQDRGLSNSVSRAALDLGNTAIYNSAAEFWPDIHRAIHRMLHKPPKQH